MQPELLRDKVVLGDGDFILLGVPRDLNYFHTVTERPRDGAQAVGCRNEKNLKPRSKSVGNSLQLRVNF